MRIVLALATVLLSRWVPTAEGALYTKFSELPTNMYDYVIVGAGTAGNVLANRLSEDPNVTILVVEAGGSDEGVFSTIVPFLGPSVTPNSPYDWNFTVAPQEGLNSRVFPYNRGRILGGSSSANGLIHQYGSFDDYDKLAAITGDDGWAWGNIKQYIYKHEEFNPGISDTGKYIPQNHGKNGTTSISLTTYPWQIDDKVLEVTTQLPDEFPFNPDTSGGNNVLGIGWVQSSIKNGSRSSSSTSYLRDAIGRPNLSVLIQHQVVKLEQLAIRDPSLKVDKPNFNGVLISSGPGAPVNQVCASREVILSAGSIGTPHLLMLSGVGATEDLERFGIRSQLDLPAVGRNLIDHLSVPVTFSAQNLDTLDTILTDPQANQAALDRWKATRDGPFASSLANQYEFFRFRSNASIFASTSDPANGPKAAHWEMVVNNYGLPGGPVPPNATFISLISTVVSPSSRGFLKLRSADPFDKPIIDPRFLSTDFDKFAQREAFRNVKRFTKAPAFSGYIIGPYGPSNAETDNEIDTFIRDYGSTNYHPVGTASMADGHSRSGVVNSKLKVKGTYNLRVVDASVWPIIPCAHTQGPTYLIAERAADIIKKEYEFWKG